MATLLLHSVLHQPRHFVVVTDVGFLRLLINGEVALGYDPGIFQPGLPASKRQLRLSESCQISATSEDGVSLLLKLLEIRIWLSDLCDYKTPPTYPTVVCNLDLGLRGVLNDCASSSSSLIADCLLHSMALQYVVLYNQQCCASPAPRKRKRVVNSQSLEQVPSQPTSSIAFVRSGLSIILTLAYCYKSL